MSEERAHAIRKGTMIAAFTVALALCVWGLVIASTKFVTALPTIGHSIETPFVSLFHMLRGTGAASAKLAAQSAVGATDTTTTAPAVSEEPAVTVVTPPSSSTDAQSAVAQAPSAPTDLSISVVRIDQSGAVFHIVNQGDVASRAGWTFTASLPVLGTPYRSPAQPSLPPHQGYTYTLGWSALFSQTSGCAIQGSITPYPMAPSNYCNGVYTTPVHGTVTITADPDHTSGDTDFRNNSASVSL